MIESRASTNFCLVSPPHKSGSMSEKTNLKGRIPAIVCSVSNSSTSEGK